MSRNQKGYSRDESIQFLMSIPEILSSSELVESLEKVEKFQFAGNERPITMLCNWKDTSTDQKFQLLGWIKGSMDKLQFRAILYIDLLTKLKFEYAMIAILENATKEEQNAYEEAFKSVKKQKK